MKMNIQRIFPQNLKEFKGVIKYVQNYEDF